MLKQWPVIYDPAGSVARNLTNPTWIFFLKESKLKIKNENQSKWERNDYTRKSLKHIIIEYWIEKRILPSACTK